MSKCLKFCVTAGMLCLHWALYGQNSVGIGTTTPNNHAVLELVSPGNNQGLLVPRLTTAQRTATAFTSALSAQDVGLLVYDNDLTQFFSWNGSAWAGLDSPQDLSLTGSTLTITNNPSATPINLSAFTGTNTDDQVITYNPVNGLLTISGLGGGNNVTITPAGAASGDLTGTYPSPTIANNAINNAKLADNAVNSAKISDGTVGTADLANGSVTAGKLANTTVTPGSYGNATTVSQITVDAQGRITAASNVAITGAAPTGAASGDLTGTYPGPTVAANAITNAKLADNSVNSAKIVDGSVAGADIGALTITAGNLAANSVTDAKVASGIAVSKLAPSSTNGQVLTTVAGATTWANTTLGTITTVNTGTGLTGGPITTTGTISVAANGITASELRSDAAVDANRSVTTNHIKDGAVTSGKLSATGVGAGSYGTATQVPQIVVDAQGRISSATNTTISGVQPGGAAGGDLAGNYPSPTINNTGPTGTNIVNAINNGATAGTLNTNRLNTAVVLDSESPTGGDVSGNFSTGLQINSGAVGSAEIADGTVSGTDIGALTITAGNLAANSVSDAKISSGITVSKLSPSSTNGQVLTTVAGNTAWANLPASGTGTVTSVATGTGLTGGPITTSGTLSLANTAVTPGTYGTSSTIPRITIDAQGRITAATTASVSTPTPDIATVLAAGSDAKSDILTNLKLLSVGSTSTSGNLNVTGSHFYSFTVAPTGNYTVKDNDYVVFVTVNTSNVIMPDAATMIGRVITLRAMDAKGFTVRNTDGKDQFDGGSTYSIAYQDAAVYSATFMAVDTDQWLTISTSKR